MRKCGSRQRKHLLIYPSVLEALSLSLSLSLFLAHLFSTPVIHLHVTWVCSSRVRLVASPCLSDLNAAAMHLDDLSSEGLDGSQDQLLVLKGRDSKAQYISVGTDERGVMQGNRKTQCGAHRSNET